MQRIGHLPVLAVCLFLALAGSAAAERVKLWGGRATVVIPAGGEIIKDGSNAYLVRLVDENRAVLRLERNRLTKKLRDSSSSRLVKAEVARLTSEGHTVESHKLRRRGAHIQFTGNLDDGDPPERFRTRVEGVRPSAELSYSAIVTAPEPAWDSEPVRLLRTAARSFQLLKR